MVLGELDFDVAGQGQIANRADGLERRVDRLDGDLEADLIVAFAGAAVRNGIGAELVGRTHQMLGNQRTGDGGDERIDAFVHGVRLEGEHAVFVGELLTGVHDICFDRAAGECTLLDSLEAFAALADVERHGNDVFAGALLEVRDCHGGVEASGIRQDDALVVAHDCPF